MTILQSSTEKSKKDELGFRPFMVQVSWACTLISIRRRPKMP